MTNPILQSNFDIQNAQPIATFKPSKKKQLAYLINFHLSNKPIDNFVNQLRTSLLRKRNFGSFWIHYNHVFPEVNFNPPFL
jgi:hypothetical protein